MDCQVLCCHWWPWVTAAAEEDDDDDLVANRDTESLKKEKKIIFKNEGVGG